MKKHDNVYMNKETGEITESHKAAVEWFREGVDVAILWLVQQWGNVGYKWVEVASWVH